MGSAAHARNLIGPVLSRVYRVRITGGHHVPRHGGVLIVSEQTGLLDPMLVATSLVRPVRMIVEPGEQAVRWQAMTSALGRIDLDPGDSPWFGLSRAIRALGAGDAVGAFTASPFTRSSLTPPGAVVAYLHARTGAPIVPLTLLDSHGPRPTDPPRPRAQIALHVAPPLSIEAPSDPLSGPEIRRHAEVIRQACADAHAEALARTGRGLSGPAHQNDPRG